MGLHLDPGAIPDPERDERQRGIAGRIELRPASRVAELGPRSLACPGCGLPVRIAQPVAVGDALVCGFCDGVAPTREYLRDTGWPEVDLVARLP